MTVFSVIILLSWLFLVAYWIISARGAKKMVHRVGPRRYLGILLIAACAIIFHSYDGHVFPRVPWVGALGAGLAVSGIAFAVWARRCLGKNWSPVPSIQENHELVTSGPYRFVRHPIYTGVIVALIGSALVSNLLWLIICAAFALTFAWRVHVEDSLMAKLFPQAYPAYRARTKALIPFVW